MNETFKETSTNHKNQNLRPSVKFSNQYLINDGKESNWLGVVDSILRIVYTFYFLGSHWKLVGGGDTLESQISFHRGKPSDFVIKNVPFLTFFFQPEILRPVTRSGIESTSWPWPSKRTQWDLASDSGYTQC